MRKSECAALENIHTLLMEGYWKLQGSWGSQMSKVRKESMKLNWNSQKGWGGGFKWKTFHGGVLIFLEQHNALCT